MTIETMQRRLRYLGWKAYELGLQNDGRWVICVTCCRHIIYAMGSTRREVWSAACSTALKLTLNIDDETNLKRLITEYEQLRKCANRLFEEWNKIDRRMVEIERALPDDYQYSADRPPLR